MRICVIIPVHNEAEGIALIVKSIKERNLEVVVIDDGSADASGVLAAQNGAYVIRNDSKRGKGMSLQAGFEYALKEGYDSVITMDGDGQHAPDDLETFLTAIKQTPQSIITGTRMSHPQGMPLLRLWTNWLMSWLISRICRQKIPDSQCGFRYIPQQILAEQPFVSADFEIETEVLIKASKSGHTIISVPIQTIYRNEKSKIKPFKDTIRFFSYLWREMRSPRP